MNILFLLIFSLKILLFNNGAYGAIQITQTTFFKNKYGVDYSSGLSFPDTEKIANAYGIKYISVKINLKNYYKINNMEKNNKFHLNLDMYCIKK